MAEPAIKGSIFRSAVEDLKRLCDEGQLSPETFVLRMTPREIELIEDGKIYDAAWYPIESYTRVIDLLASVDGGGSGYHRRRGAGNAKRLIDAGLYEQLEFLSRWERKVNASERSSADAMVAAYERALRLVVSLSGSIYNVGSWRVERDPGNPNRVRIEVSDASAYSDSMCFAIEGFFNECTRAVRPEAGNLFLYERLGPDRFVIAMARDIPELDRPKA